MPAARGVKRAASKSAAATASTGPKNKKKRGAIQLEIPTAPKRRGRVLTCGQGDVGQLGLGEDVIETSKFKFVTALGDKIVDVYAGGMHTIALDSSGKVWTFGCNDEGALGRSTADESDEGAAKSVALPARAVAVSAGDSHSAALLANGDVYAWGAFRDSHGSMGLVVRGREGKSSKSPVKLELGEPAAALASGGDHLVILSTSGSVYTMGCGEQGQLGRLSQRSASRDARQGLSALLVPSKVTLKAGASRIWAGYHATFVLDANSEKMFAWGLNNYGQLGITGEKRKTALYAPTECDAFSRHSAGWAAVAPGQHHSLALDNNGQVYAIGRCEYGRLGLGDRPGDAEVLEPIPALQNKKCISIAAGTSNSFAVTQTGEVVSWGMGSEGTLGTGSSEDCAAPTPAVTPALAPRLPVHVSAGGQHTVLLVEDPNPQKEDSPPPETETSEQKVEQESQDSQESQEEAEEEEEEPKSKRPKSEQEEEISSTVSAQPSEVGEETKPQKVNGDEKKETPMEVDETDNKLETEKKADTETKSEQQTEWVGDITEGSQTQSEHSKPESTSCSSQESTDSESKVHPEPQQTATDVDMPAERTEEDPNPQKEDSPPPETETSEQKVEQESQDSQESQEEAEEEEEEPKSKRQKSEQEEEISSTVSAQPSEVGEETKPQKVNGDEKKETPMEVDETDNKLETEKKADTETKSEQQTEWVGDITEGSQTQSEHSKPESTSCSSQESTDSESKVHPEPQQTATDVDMPAERTEEDPNPQKEDSPPPETETSEQKVEQESQDSQESQEEAEEEEEEPKSKRPKSEQEEEISSTVSAQPSEVGEETKPQKVNGDEKKETPMEVDETDNKLETEKKADTETKSEQQTEWVGDITEGSQTQSEHSKPESTSCSSQESTDSESKVHPEPQQTATDVDMPAERTEEDPNPQKEDSPPPETETSEQKVEQESQDSQESQEEAEEEEEEPKSKRPKSEQEEEISSTVSAQPSEVGEETKPQKVNGDEKKETPMEVDETDNKLETEKKADTETKPEQQTEWVGDITEGSQTQSEHSKPESTSCSSQESTDSESKVHPEPQQTATDVDMPAERTEVNGTPDSQIVETKSVDVISGNPITTTA